MVCATARVLGGPVFLPPAAANVRIVGTRMDVLHRFASAPAGGRVTEHYVHGWQVCGNANYMWFVFIMLQNNSP